MITERLMELQTRMKTVRSVILFPFQLWLWFVSIPIRIALYFTFGEFWKRSEVSSAKKINRPTSVAPPVVEKKVATQPASSGLRERPSTFASTSTLRAPLVSGETSVMNDPGRNVLPAASNWQNSFSFSSTPVKQDRSTLTQVDAFVMNTPSTSEVSTTTDSSLSAKSTSSSSKPAPHPRPLVDIENRIGSFISVDKEEVAKVRHEADRFATFIPLDEDVEGEVHQDLVSMARKTHKKSPSKSENKPETKHEEIPSRPAVDSVALQNQIDSLLREKEILQSRVEAAEKQAKDKETLLAITTRENFDMQQALAKEQFHVKEDTLVITKLKADNSTLQHQVEDVEQQKKTKTQLKKEKKAAKKRAEEEEAKKKAEEEAKANQNVWSSHGQKGYTEMVAEAQKELLTHPKSFAEVIKESATETIPIEKTASVEFTVVGGQESTMHTVESLAAK